MVHWTQEMRRHMYGLIVFTEGPYRKWKRKTAPPALLKKLARAMTRRYGVSIPVGAVRGQINWAITMQASVKNSGLLWNLVLNKAAAQEEGFIDRSLVPQSASFTYRQSSQKS